MSDADLSHMRYLSPSEVKGLLSLSRATVYRLLDQGDLVSIRIGRARRVRLDDLVAFVDAHKMPNN
jgi:excisionase family DNA binding protein